MIQKCFHKYMSPEYIRKEKSMIFEFVNQLDIYFKGH